MEKQKIEIIVIDDNETHLLLFNEYIKLFNTQCTSFDLVVTSSSSPKEVIEKKLYQEKDIFITDYDMPEMTGQELIDHIKKQSHNIRVFIGSSNDEKNKFRFDVDYFIHKKNIVNLQKFTEVMKLLIKKNFKQTQDC